MDSLALVSSRPLTAPSRNPSDFLNGRPSRSPLFVPLTETGRSPSGARRPRYLVSALGRGIGGRTSQGLHRNAMERLTKEGFASVSSSTNAEITSIGTSQMPVPPPPSSIGSPLFWIGVGVGFSALFSWVANYLKKYAMQQAFKTLMNQMPTKESQFSNSAMFTGQTFSFPTTSTATAPPRSPSPAASQPALTVDVPATKVESTTSTDIREEVITEKDSKKYAFVDVSPEEVSQSASADGFRYPNEVSSSNGYAGKTGESESGTNEPSQSRKSSLLSVEALEKMMEDPTVQKMVFPYLPEEMRNPTTFKWMLQNPQYRQQLQEMLDNMGGNTEWESKMMDSLKNFDLSSPEVKQQFDQLGLTPEDVISKIMANPDIAMSFQNPKVQAAIVDCSQNPLNISKYQNDKEVMDVFQKISELFPGGPGSF